MPTYSHILSPIRIGGKTLKSHLLNSKCVPSSLESMDALHAFYTDFARKGSATVTMDVGSWPDCEGRRSRMTQLDMLNADTRAGFARIVEDCHKYGTLCGASLMNVEPQYVAISDTPNWNEIPKNGDYSRNFSNKHGISYDRIQGMIDDFVHQCRELKSLGFDMATIYMSYRGSILACSLSPLLNQRTDKYGGATIAERATLSLEIFRAIKQACGQDFLLECQISATEEEPGYTLEDFLDYAKLCEGLVDIFQLRGYEGSSTHVNGYNFTPDAPLNLKYAEAFKKRGIRALVSPVGGFLDLDRIDRWIAEGKTDCVSMARGFICDEDFGEKLQSGRGCDITPCLLCNGCHGGTCAVNPEAGYQHLLVDAPRKAPRSKKVAIIGGGPAGMRAAVLAVQRGHDVTLYEASDSLGGQLKFARYPAFKWPLANYCSWLVRTVSECGARILLNTAATPQLLASRGYDAIIAALGSGAASIDVPGADGENVWTVDRVYGHEAELGKRVVVVGGGESGRETALYLAECGHDVTMLTRSAVHLYDDDHARLACENRFKANSNFHYMDYAATREIGDGYLIAEVKTGMPKFEMTRNGGQNGPVGGFDGAQPGDPEYYGPAPMLGGHGGPGGPGGDGLTKAANVSTIDGRMPDPVQKRTFGPGHGGMHGMPGMPEPDLSKVTTQIVRLEFDSIVVSGGRKSRTEEAEAFFGLAPQVFVIGDNSSPGSVRACTADAYAAVCALDEEPKPVIAGLYLGLLPTPGGDKYHMFDLRNGAAVINDLGTTPGENLRTFPGGVAFDMPAGPTVHQYEIRFGTPAGLNASVVEKEGGKVLNTYSAALYNAENEQLPENPDSGSREGPGGLGGPGGPGGHGGPAPEK